MMRRSALRLALLLAVSVCVCAVLGQDKPEKSPRVVWNDGEAKLVLGPWAKEEGMGALQEFPPVEPRGYEYTQDFLKWASFLLTPEFLPSGIEDRAIPLRMGQVPCLGGLAPKSAVKGKDGFVVRFRSGRYICQLADTRYDFRILLRDLERKEKKYEPREMADFGKRLMHLTLRKEILHYPDGSPRMLKTQAFGTHAYAQWNWQITDARQDDAATGWTSLARPYGCFGKWRTDGRSILISFQKTYFRARSENWLSSTRSRFESSALFHDVKQDKKE